MSFEDHLFFCAPNRLIIREGARHDLAPLLKKLGHGTGVPHHRRSGNEGSRIYA